VSVKEEPTRDSVDDDGGARGVTKVERRRQRIQQLKERSNRLHRSILVPRVLKGLLPLRAHALAYRAGLAESQDREARFRTASASYVQALPDDQAFAGQTRVIDLDSLRWWVPLLHPDDAAAVTHYLEHQDFPYRAILQTREVALGGVMLDLGANIGRMSIPRVILGDVTAAYCAEPDPLNFTCLVRNVRDNHLTGLVLPDNVAIGSENGSVQLQRESSAGGHRIVDAPSRRKGKSIEVAAVTVDSWTERLGLDLRDISFVKVDAQGSELHILRGATRLLAQRHVAWQIEIDPLLLATRGISAENLFAALQPHFTHFIDLNRTAVGSRVHAIGDLAAALGYIAVPGNRTDVLAFNLRPADPALNDPLAPA
jgi:FkbM family methyltransferase